MLGTMGIAMVCLWAVLTYSELSSRRGLSKPIDKGDVMANIVHMTKIFVLLPVGVLLLVLEFWSC